MNIRRTSDVSDMKKENWKDTHGWKLLIVMIVGIIMAVIVNLPALGDIAEQTHIQQSEANDTCFKLYQAEGALEYYASTTGWPGEVKGKCRLTECRTHGRTSHVNGEWMREKCRYITYSYWEFELNATKE